MSREDVAKHQTEVDAHQPAYYDQGCLVLVDGDSVGKNLQADAYDWLLWNTSFKPIALVYASEVPYVNEMIDAYPMVVVVADEGDGAAAESAEMQRARVYADSLGKQIRFLLENEDGEHYLWPMPLHENHGLKGRVEVLEAIEADADDDAADNYNLIDSHDPFADAIGVITDMNLRKRADYASDADIFSNFREAGAAAGITALQCVNALVGVKEARIRQLEAKDAGPENESLVDSYLDRAVYAIIAYAIATEEA